MSERDPRPPIRKRSRSIGWLVGSPFVVSMAALSIGRIASASRESTGRAVEMVLVGLGGVVAFATLFVLLFSPVLYIALRRHRALLGMFEQSTVLIGFSDAATARILRELDSSGDLDATWSGSVGVVVGDTAVEYWVGSGTPRLLLSVPLVEIDDVALGGRMAARFVRLFVVVSPTAGRLAVELRRPDRFAWASEPKATYEALQELVLARRDSLRRASGE